MCGICGILEYKHSRVADDPFNRTVLAGMLKVLHHRGPDDIGSYVTRDLAMGMRRLSIIDLAGGKQPIGNEDGSVVTVFNGEIYNYRELTTRLQQAGHRFVTASDTEVIVHLYEEAGDAFVHELRGMFAIALWDNRRKRLLIARDRLGIKPLYYTSVDGCLVFGSEIKAILQHPTVTARLDLRALNHYLSLRFVPAPHTLFAGINSLPPGHLLICDDQGVQVRRYWDLSFVNEPNPAISEAAYAEQLEALLEETIRLHLRSDVPFGAFLSGGIDSSLIVAYMSQQLGQPVKTFSVGFERVDAEGDELPYARAIARKYHTDHHEIVIRPQDFIDHAHTAIWHLDQPIADQATVATYMLSRLARQNVKMVLTGEGGDELFAGYARYSAERLSPLFRPVPTFAKNTALRMASHLPGMRRAKLALYALCQNDESNRFLHWFPLFTDEMKADLAVDQLRRDAEQDSTQSLIAQYLAQTDASAAINRLLYVDSKLWLPDYLLLRGDKLTMAASIEARVPFLDHRLVEFAASLPVKLKVKGSIRKYVLKKVGRRYLPDHVINRTKKGFPIPLDVWFRKEARTFLYDLLSPAAIRRRGLFNAEYVSQLLAEHDSGFAAHQTALWGLASVELWHQIFIDKAQAGSLEAPEAPEYDVQERFGGHALQE